jgi:hypothetical protein
VGGVCTAVVPPRYYNLGQNKTTDIAAGDKIKFYANWTDAVLDFYIFSWNQSGTFVNDSVMFPLIIEAESGTLGPGLSIASDVSASNGSIIVDPVVGSNG